MDIAELDRMALTELEKQGILLFADPLIPAELEPPRAAGRTMAFAQWALLAFLVAVGVLLAVTLL
jgi:hypothetical protein